MKALRSYTVRYAGGVPFHSCSLLVEIHSLLATRCKITRYSMQKLLAAKNHSLLVAKFARYSLQKLLVAKIHSSLIVKFTRY